VAGDAGYGYDLPLRLIDQMGARRVVDLRAHATDADKLQWRLRGYDDRGRPVCAYGYAFHSSGFDFERRRHKWVCAGGRARTGMGTHLASVGCRCAR